MLSCSTDCKGRNKAQLTLVLLPQKNEASKLFRAAPQLLPSPGFYTIEKAWAPNTLWQGIPLTRGYTVARRTVTFSPWLLYDMYHRSMTFAFGINTNQHCKVNTGPIIKVMLEVFFDSQGLMHHEFIPEGRTVTKELYVETLRRLWDAVRRKRPEKWVENNWFLMHDNAPAHRAIIVKNFLARHNITALDHPPYSPDLSPPDYFLFPRLKSHLKGRRFNAEEVIANATRALRGFHKMTSRPASRNSTRVGKSVLLRKATILKGML
ncbi:hypothetical protein ANN_05891 [Periplaneta americana]|uniref:Mariner Mos1 transposase n=1 Tax=Periplaneta americana TaxID=6978 RepID=A0ABQ8TC17_PERAM|nr:hypothetical protein ANN_05891 [Periplaneta americana]